AKADRKNGAEGHGHLAEDVAGQPLADHAVDAVDAPNRLDAAVEDGEERPRCSLSRRVFAADEGDVRGHARQALARGVVKALKDLDRADLLRSHHLTALTRQTVLDALSL